MNQRLSTAILIILIVVGLALFFYLRAGNKGTQVMNSTDNQDPAASLEASSSTQSINPKKQYSAYPGDLPLAELSNKKAVIDTSKGTIEFEIYADATKAASNFITLARDNYFDGLIFHRVVPNFVIQTGSPDGSGNGGPGYKFPDDPVTRPYKKGTVAMANSGPNTNGSQFFITTVDNPPLDPLYSIFGQVISGQDVVDKIQRGDVMKKVTIENLK